MLERLSEMHLVASEMQGYGSKGVSMRHVSISVAAATHAHTVVAPHTCLFARLVRRLHRSLAMLAPKSPLNPLQGRENSRERSLGQEKGSRSHSVTVSSSSSCSRSCLNLVAVSGMGPRNRMAVASSYALRDMAYQGGSEVVSPTSMAAALNDD